MTQSTQPNSARRWILVGALALGVGAFSLLAFGGIGDNLVYYWSPTELEAAEQEAVGASVRLGGLVADGSIERSSSGELLFSVTDGDTVVAVRADAVPPAMFREGIGVVLEGTMANDGVFETTKLMVKHDNEYQAPETGDERSVEELMETMQFGGET
ncbi:MAG: cytochrome c maturation protein CcmE [Acidobacteriota bacterium]